MQVSVSVLVEHAASVGLRHARMSVSVSDSHVSVLLNPAELGPDPTTEHCGRRCILIQVRKMYLGNMAKIKIKFYFNAGCHKNLYIQNRQQKS